MKICHVGGLPPYHCFEQWPQGNAQHAIFGRTGGVSQGQWSSLNVGHTVGDCPEHVDENHARVYAALGITAHQVVTAQQVAGDQVAIVTKRDTGHVLPATDALVTTEPDIYLMLRFADCVPILLWSREKQVVGLAHAGWRGTVKGIAARAAATMIESMGCAPDEINAGIGPSIGPCCFEVGPEVVGAFEQRFPANPEIVAQRLPQGKALIDLWRANAVQLQALGIVKIEVSPHCTQCEHTAWFSHRADEGATGRFGALIGLREHG